MKGRDWGRGAAPGKGKTCTVVSLWALGPLVSPAHTVTLHLCPSAQGFFGFQVGLGQQESTGGRTCPPWCPALRLFMGKAKAEL